MEALHWVHVLLRRSRLAVMAHHSALLPALFDALNADSDKVVQEALAVQVGFDISIADPHVDSEVQNGLICSALFHASPQTSCCLQIAHSHGGGVGLGKWVLHLLLKNMY